MKKVLEEVQNQQDMYFYETNRYMLILYVTNTVAFILCKVFFCSEKSPVLLQLM
jgi:hypothetical protein